MRGKFMLYVDQWGNKFYARTIKELREKIGGGRVSKMYVDREGRAYHSGYVVGRHWCEAYIPYVKLESN